MRLVISQLIPADWRDRERSHNGGRSERMLLSAIPIPLLLILSGLLLSVLLSIIIWGYLAPWNDTLSLQRFDTLLLSLLVVAGFAFALFLTVMFAL